MVLHHTDTKKTFKEAYRVLSPSGKIGLIEFGRVEVGNSLFMNSKFNYG